MTILVARGEYRDSAGDARLVLLSTHPWSDPDLGNADPVIPASSDPEYRSRIAFPSMEQAAHQSYGSIEVINADGRYDEWLEGTFAGRRWQIRQGESWHTWDELTPHFIAQVAEIRFRSTRSLQIVFRDSALLLRNPVQAHSYPPHTPNEDLRGRLMPTIIGVPEHVPTDLYDAVSSSEERYFVADNFNGTLWTSGDNGGCKEGLATIPQGTSGGEYEEWSNGFDTHKSPTLPLTALFAKGPRKRLIHWLDAHFSRWGHDEDDHPIPGGDWSVYNAVNEGTAERWCRRWGDTDGVHFRTISTTTGWCGLHYEPTILEEGKEYVLRIWTRPEKELSNRTRLRWTFLGGTVGVSTGEQYIEWPDGLTELAIGPVPEGAQTLRLELARHDDDETESEPSEVRILRVQLVPVVESGGGSAAGIMTQAHELIPYVLLERGETNMMDLPPDFETGPLHPSQINYASLESLVAAHPGVFIAWWWDDDTTHEQLLDRIIASHNGAWWFDRQDRLTAASIRDPSAWQGDPPDTPPVWDSGGQQAVAGATMTGPSDDLSLTIDAPSADPGDSVMIIVITAATSLLPVGPWITVDGASLIDHGVEVNPSLGQGGVYVFHRQVAADDPDEYVVRAGVEVDPPPTLTVLAARVTGVDPDSPIGGVSEASSASPSSELEVPSVTVQTENSLVVSLAGAIGMAGSNAVWRDQPSGPVYSDDSSDAGLAVSVQDYQPGPTGEKMFEVNNDVPLFLGFNIVLSPAFSASPEIHSDRFQTVAGSMAVDDDLAPRLTTQLYARRNFRPMGEGEVAELNVPSLMRARYRREWVATRGVGPALAASLDPMYRHAKSAAPRETAIGPFSTQGGGTEVARTMVRLYDQPRRLWRHHRTTRDGAQLGPGQIGVLTSQRYGLVNGRMYIAIDVRVQRHRLEIVGWG